MAPKATIRLFTGEEPVPKIPGIRANFTLRRPEPDERTENGLRALGLMHAKIYAFCSGKRVALFWGSANLSESAWLRCDQRANVDLLVRATCTRQQWERFLNALPEGHKWVPAEARSIAWLREKKSTETLWALIHGVVEHGELRLSATASGRRNVVLRSIAGAGPVRCTLTFKDSQAVLHAKHAKRLGFERGQGPSGLKWYMGRGLGWGAIPINFLDPVDDHGVEVDLAQQLYEEFAGCPLPGRGGVRPPPPPGSDGGDGDDHLEDEDELALSDHQGAMDRFVLEWRALARRVARAACENEDLHRHYAATVVKRVLSEAARKSSDWPRYKIDFVKKLMERPWQE
jgi:hypothetical protein